MVLGLKTRNRRNASVQVNYLISIQEIKPWPPSQSLRSVRSVLIQWEHGDRSSGSTSSVAPSLGPGVGDGKIEFNESFRFPVTLLREMSVKGGGEGDMFQKNCVEFNLYETRRDKASQLLATAVVDLAAYGVVKEIVGISAQMDCKRSFRNTAQPIMFLKIQPVEKGSISSSSRESLSKEVSLGRNGAESVSALMNEEYAEEADVNSFTDDDDSSHSSLAVTSSAIESNGGSPPQSEQTGSEAMKDSPVEAEEENGFESKKVLNSVIQSHESPKMRTSFPSATEFSSDVESAVIGHATLGNFPDPSFTSIPKNNTAHSVQSSFTPLADEETDDDVEINLGSNLNDLTQQGHGKMIIIRTENRDKSQVITQESIMDGPLCKVSSPITDPQVNDTMGFSKSGGSVQNGKDDDKTWNPSSEDLKEAAITDGIVNGSTDDNNRREHHKNGQESQELEDELSHIPSVENTKKEVLMGSSPFPFSNENHGIKSSMLNSDKLKHVKSVRSPGDSGRSNGSLRSSQFVERGNDVSVSVDAEDSAPSFFSSDKKDDKVYPEETKNIYSNNKVKQLERRIRVLEDELRETAAIEVGLYSIVAEHGSSINKVHAPARRLARLYLYACKENLPSRGASAAKSAVSGLVLVAKACGNDVQRLTFWLSNCVVLRAIICQAVAEEQLSLSAGPLVERTGGGTRNNKKSSSLRWKKSSLGKDERGSLCESFDEWEDPRTFTSALEKIEAWIFSRIVESVWWQTMTPYMQSAAAKEISRTMVSNSSKLCKKTSNLDNQDQVNFSLEIWKKAFRDTCERLCPVRAGGHECGCLAVLARLIMEQCVARLDVAMFNAILRESDDDIPTNPISDPISDAKVLPIPAGKASFGAGAQLKNVIGNWSRWLTDLFGIEDVDSVEDENSQNNNDDERVDTSFKSFHLLNALSDLMMLPKDLLLSRSIRKEVCPTFGTPLIKRILNNFVPDEFCPDPIPDVVLEALNSEDPLETEEGSVMSFPCTAPPILYMPPSAASFSSIIGETESHSQLKRNKSSVLRKSYTSDDELEELDSPVALIINNILASPTSATKPTFASKEHNSRTSVRYQLLREVWMNSE